MGFAYAAILGLVQSSIPVPIAFSSSAPVPHHFQAMTAAYLSTSIYLCIQCKLPCNTTPNGLCYLHQHILFVMCKWKLHGSDHFVSIILLCSTTISLAWIWVAVHYLWAQPPHIHGFGYGVAVHSVQSFALVLIYCSISTFTTSFPSQSCMTAISLYNCIQCKLSCNATLNALCYLHQHLLFVIYKWKLHGKWWSLCKYLFLLCSTTLHIWLQM